MKQLITITRNGKVVYDGRIADIPIQHDAIIAKSVALFDDDDPCIIHQSYVIKEYVDELLTLFGNAKELRGADYQSELDFLDVAALDQCVFRLKG